MNKKFSTLMTAGFLVAGALFTNVNATDVRSSAELKALMETNGTLKEGAVTDNELVFHAGSYEIPGYLLIDQEDFTVRGVTGDEVTFTGKLVINAEDVTVEGIKFVTNSTGHQYWTKNAITAFADKLTIKDNEFTQGERSAKTWVANGIIVFPKLGTTVDYAISGNTFNGFNYSATDGSTSTSISIQTDFTLTAKTGDPVNGTTDLAVPAIADAEFNPADVVAGNTFENCYLDYLYKTGNEYTQTQITYSADYALSIEEAVQLSATDGTSTIVVKGAASDVLGALEAATIANIKGKNVVITCDDAYLLLGTAVAPKTDKQAIIVLQAADGTIAASAAPELSGSQRLVASRLDGEYYLLSAGNGLFVSDATGKLIDVEKDATVTTSDAALWKVTQAVSNKVYRYTFVNKAGDQLAIDGDEFTSRAGYKNGFVLVAANDKNVSVNTGKTALEAASGSETYLGLYEVGFNTYPAGNLNNKLGNSFNLGTTEAVEKSALINQALRAVYLTVGGKTAQYFAVANTIELGDNDYETAEDALVIKDFIKNDEERLEMLENAEFVVVGTKSYMAEAATTGKGYAYSTKKGSDLFDFAKDKANAGIDKAQFKTGYSVNIKLEDVNSLIITQAIKFGQNVVTVRPQIMTADVANAEGVMEEKFFLVTMDLAADVDWSVINFDGLNGVAKDYFDGVSFNASVGNTKENPRYDGSVDWVYGPARSLEDPAKSNINPNGAEGQFVLRYGKEITHYDEKGKPQSTEGFWMYNRESSTTGLENSAQTVRYLGKSIFRVKDASNQLTNKYYLADGPDGPFGPNSNVVGAHCDTITLAPVELCHDRLGGYGHYQDGDAAITFDKVNLAKTAYRLGIKNGSFDGIAYISNSSTHNNQLSVNIKDEDGLRFYLVPGDTVAYGLNISKKKYSEVVADAAKDSLYRVSYAIQERATKRFVGFNDGKLELNATNTNAKSAQQFFFKEKGDGKFVIVSADYYTNSDAKVFANIGDASLHAAGIYDGNIADEFVLDTVASPKYADILKTSKDNNDTTLVKINLYSVQNLVGTSSYMLTPDANNFLVEGVPAKSLKAAGGKEYPAAGFDLVVDTAYVNRLGNTMPMYYLAMNGAARLDSVGPLHKGDKDENDHDIACGHFNGNDTVVGKYLFAMYDSIYFSKEKDPEVNCYHYTNTDHFARLRFVDAVHVKDTMIIGNDTTIAKNVMKAGAVKTNIPANRQYDWLNGFETTKELGDEINGHNGANAVYDNFGLFAFEINPANDKEYAIYSPATGLYVAYINGNVVMAPQASYYTMVDGNNGTLVDNETIETTEVTVIAGNGQVTIHNAAGKTVTISNILGQTLANTVLTSDNATISVPAGIVVVAVEGEAAVKAIIK